MSYIEPTQPVPQTPPSEDEEPELDENGNAIIDLNCDEDMPDSVPVEEEEEEDSSFFNHVQPSPPLNRYQPRTPGTHALEQKKKHKAAKRSRVLDLVSEDEAEDMPDLGAYFHLFDISELDQVKVCRAYANYLSAKGPNNRIRWSSKSSGAFKNRK